MEFYAKTVGHFNEEMELLIKGKQKVILFIGEIYIYKYFVNTEFIFNNYKATSEITIHKGKLMREFTLKN